MSKIWYSVKSSKESEEIGGSYDFKQAKKLAKKTLNSNGSAIIEFINEDVDVCIDEIHLIKDEV